MVASAPPRRCVVPPNRSPDRPERLPHARRPWIWDRLAGGGYASDSYVHTGSDGRVAPACGRTPAPTPAPTTFPADAQRASDEARYDDAAAWAGGRNCTGGFTPGARQLQAWIRANWGAATIQGYSCRPNTADTRRTSLHGVGRASDWFRDAGNAKHRRQVARFIERLSANRAAMARAMGVQYWIWNTQQYSVRGTSVYKRAYTGPNPHTDHVHVEQNLRGAQLRTSCWRLVAKG